MNYLHHRGIRLSYWSDESFNEPIKFPASQTDEVKDVPITVGTKWRWTIRVNQKAKQQEISNAWFPVQRACITDWFHRPLRGTVWAIFKVGQIRCVLFMSPAHPYKQQSLDKVREAWNAWYEAATGSIFYNKLLVQFSLKPNSFPSCGLRIPGNVVIDSLDHRKKPPLHGNCHSHN